MGTHPIFESDFDCLTDMLRFFINPVGKIMRPRLIIPLMRNKSIQSAQSNQSVQSKSDSVNPSDEDASGSGGGFKKTLFLGISGLAFLSYFLAASTQLPLDPDRMTPAKLEKMTEKERIEFEETQKSMAWYQALGAQFPSMDRWCGAIKIIWETALKDPLGTFCGLKLGYDYYCEVHEPEWKVA